MRRLTLALAPLAPLAPLAALAALATGAAVVVGCGSDDDVGSGDGGTAAAVDGAAGGVVTSATTNVAFMLDLGGLGPATPDGSSCTADDPRSFALDLQTAQATYSYCGDGAVYTAQRGVVTLDASDLAAVRSALAAITSTQASGRGCADCSELYVDVTSGEGTARYYEATQDAPEGAANAQGVGDALQVLSTAVEKGLPPSTG